VRQEEARAHLPTHHVPPLVDEQRQVAIAADPALKRVADHSLGGRAHDQRFGERGVGVRHQAAALGLKPVMGDDRHLLGEPLHMLALLREEAQGNEEREIAVVVAERLDAAVQLRLDQLPDAVAPRLDDHTAAHRGDLG
jgi:hypothetical protein